MDSDCCNGSVSSRGSSLRFVVEDLGPVTHDHTCPWLGQALGDRVHYAAPPAYGWPSRLPGTCQVFPKLPVSFSRFSLEDFYLAHTSFVCFASTAIRVSRNYKNEILQLS